MARITSVDPSKHERSKSKSLSESVTGNAYPDASSPLPLTLTAGILLAVNCLAAVLSPIPDCDEVFNYWEPTHYLNHGYGLQTWEYSPEYAIRSWLYIMLHAAIGRLSWIFSDQKLDEFIFIRLILGMICVSCQLKLLRVVSRHVGSRVAFIMLLAMASSTGMFYASVAYLPSSFCMCTTMMGMAALMDAKDGIKTSQGIMWFGIGAIVGWPFSAALIVPLFVDELVYIKLTGNIRGAISRCFRGTAILLPITVSGTYLSLAIIGFVNGPSRY